MNKRTLSALLTLITVAIAVINSVAFAQSRNEVEISVLFDGAPGFDAGEPTAPTPSGVAPQTHTPGLDGGSNNLVVRNRDLFSVRIDWNINEDVAEDARLTVVLPAFAEWSPDDTGMFAGCAPLSATPASSISADGRTLICVLNDQAEGSNGTIRPVAKLLEGLDNRTFDVPVTLTTTADTTGVNDSLDTLLTVSEGPRVDLAKNTPQVSSLLTVGGVEGFVVLYPISVVDFSQIPEPGIGDGPINDAERMVQYDHMWDITPSVRLASDAEFAASGFAGTNCGPYAGSGPFTTAPVTWECGSEVIGVGGYPVVEIAVSDFTSRPFPPTLADGSANNPNAPQIVAGQIALWLTRAEVDDAIEDINNASSTVSARFFNSITDFDGGTAITDESQVVPVDGNGTSGPSARGSAADNTVPANFGAVVPPGSSGSPNHTGHTILFYEGPLELIETTAFNDNEPRLSVDARRRTLGNILVNGSEFSHGNLDGVDVIGDVPRGSSIVIDAIATTIAPAGNSFDAPLHGCVALDNTHYALEAIDSIPVSQIESVRTGANPQTIGAFSIAGPNSGPLAYVLSGGAFLNRNGFFGIDSSTPGVEVPMIVEFTNAALQTDDATASFGAEHDQLTCLDSDAGSEGWVDSTDTAGLAAFEGAVVDGVYDDITRVRFRWAEPRNWSRNDAEDARYQLARVLLQARVRSDLTDQRANQELFAMISTAYGELGADGLPNFERFAGEDPGETNCRPEFVGPWTQSGNDVATTTGWCHNRFIDDGVNSLDTTDVVDWPQDSSILNFGPTSFQHSGTVARIVVADLILSKVNLDGLGDIKDNGQTVDFALRPSVVGSTAEALTNVRLTDNLNGTNYQFVEFVQQPSSPGASCTEAGGVINCQFSEPDSEVDTGDLLAGLNGGWSDEVIIRVMVTGAVANSDSATVLTNTAIAQSDALGPWDSVSDTFTATPSPGPRSRTARANSFLPLPADESVIAKTVNVLEGPCEVIPTGFTGTLAEWQARCSLIDLDDNMSFDLTIENEGNTALTQIEFVDVFPYTGDGTDPETASNTPNQNGSTPTNGDGRSPASDFTGTVTYVGVTGVNVPVGATLVTWVSGDTPASISRDPARSLAENTWCNNPLDAGGTLQNPSTTSTTACPATTADVRAVYVLFDGGAGLLPDSSATIRLELDSQGAQCDDLWTNTFGSRSEGLLLPIRSNDVSVMTRCVSLGSTAWVDTDGDGIQDAGEPPIVAATVTLLNDDGSVFDSDTSTAAIEPLTVGTDSQGQYNFNGLPEGDYRVQINLNTASNPNAPLLIPTPGQIADPDAPGPGQDNNTDSNIDRAFDTNTTDQIHTSGIVTLSFGGEPTGEVDPIGTPGVDQPNQGLTAAAQPDANGNMTVDFGFIEPVSLGSTLWFDTDADGVQDSGEPPIIGATITLLNADGSVYDSDPTTPGDQALTVLTDGQGQYNFNGLPAGDYRVQASLGTSTSHAGLSLSPTLAQVADPDAAGPGQDNNTDSNVDVTAPGHSPATGVFQSGIVTLSLGGEPTGETDPIGTPGPDQPNQTVTEFDANGNMTVDMGFFAPVSLGSTIWNDTDADGTQDAGEPAIVGARITLLNDDGTVYDSDPATAGLQALSVLTDGDGQYNFDNLPPDDYRVQVDLSTVVGGDDFIPTPVQVADPDAPGAGQNNNTDSNVDTAFDLNTADQIHTSGIITLAPGTEPTNEVDPIGAGGPDQPNQGLTVSDDPDNSGNMTVDFGFIRPVSLGSSVWFDSDGDGTQDPLEPAIQGVTVTLLNDDGSVYDSDPNTAGDQALTAITDANGQYNFNDLPEGDYRVQVDLSTATTPNAAAFVPTPVQVADPDALGAGLNNNDDSNIDTAFDTITTDQIHTSGIITLSIGDEPTGEQDAIGVAAASADQPGQGLNAANQPDANGNMTVDFGFVEPVSIGSFVWQDSDGDGVQDAGEPGIENATVSLLVEDPANPGTFIAATDVAGTAIVNVVTGADGLYEFDNLPPGNYRVRVTPPTGFEATPVQDGADNSDTLVSDELDSNINTTATGVPAGTFESGTFTLSSGDEPNETDAAAGDNQDGTAGGAGDLNGNNTVDFGFIAPVSIGSFVFNDANGDGTQDALEPGIENAVVALFVEDSANPGTFIAATDLDGATVLDVTTGTDGLYEFDNLPPGNYQVQVTPPAGVVPSPVQVTTVDSNAEGDSNIASSPSTGVYRSPTMTLTSGGEPNEADTFAGDTQDGAAGSVDDLSGNMTVDFGFITPVSIGSFVWEDEDLDGVQDAGEPGIANATVTLWVDNGSGTFVAATDLNSAAVGPVTTGSDGLYEFDNLPPGDYRVRVTPPAEFGASPVQDTAANSDTTAADELDSNIADEPVSGTYESATFNLSSLGEPNESDTAAGDTQDGTSGSNADLSGNNTVDFGFVTGLSVGSLIWEDLNGDGTQDANEPPIAGAQVTLFVSDGLGGFDPAINIAGATVPPIVTGPDGLYVFGALPRGDYKVQVTPPAGLFPTTVNSTADDNVSTDSNIADEPSTGTFDSGVFTLDSFTEVTESGADRGDNQDDGGADTNGNMTIDFGFVPPASLGNFVWLDLDMDGVQDANEDGIAGVTVNLFADSNGDGLINGAELTTPVATATTGPNGEYLFPGLEPGVAYQTGVDTSTLPSGLVQTFDEGDGVGATDSLSDPIVLTPNEFHETADFGYAPPAGLGAVGDTIWVDADDDGVQDPGEPGLEGITVSITPAPDVDLGAGAGVPITTVTDENGKYLFPNLPLDETYIVEVDTTTLPAGYVSGPSNLGDPDVRDGNSTAADDQTTVVITADDPINLDLDFGYLPPPDQNNSIGDTLWIDVDEDGNGPAGAGDDTDTTEQPIPGVTVSLVNAAGAVIATTITDANGMYLFTGIPDGIYDVRVTDQNNVLAGLDPTADSDDPANPGAFAPTTPNVSRVDLDSASASATPVEDLDQDFGYVDPNSSGGDGSIGDTIFFDEDSSGAPDAGEGIEGVTVELFGPGPDGVIGGGDDVLLASTTTDANGNYLFTGLDTSNTGPNPGTDYQVVVDTSTLPNGGAGWTNTVDPDTVGTGDSESVTALTATAPVDLDQDFGYESEDDNSLSGTVWPDTNGDGELVETGRFEGVTIELRDQDGNVIQTTVTDADGDFSFDNLPDGVYTVIVTDEDNVLNGFEHTDSPNGASDTSDQTSKDDTGYEVDLDSAGVSDDPVTDTTSDFGYEPEVTNPISLGSFIATSAGGGNVRIEWMTQTEVANLGFNLYALVDGEWQLLNESLILSQGDSVAVQSYSATYSVESSVFAISDIDLAGKETMHGPFRLGEPYGQVSDRQVIDWQAEKAEREAKQARRDAERMRQQEQRMQSLKQLRSNKKNNNKSN